MEEIGRRFNPVKDKTRSAERLVGFFVNADYWFAN